MTSKSEILSLSSDEFKALCKSSPARTRYRVTVEPELPIKGEAGGHFRGYASAKVTRAEFLRVGLSALSPQLEIRGACISVRIYTDIDYRCLYI